MSDQSTGFLGDASTAFVKKASEGAANRAVNAIVDICKKKFGEAQVSLGTAFTLYLKNARQRYNKVKTIATGTQPRSIIGSNDLYVQIGVSYQGKEYSTQSIEKLLPISKHLLIEGTGGAGKSMLMRYLFLDTSYGGNYVPILLELHRIGSLTSKDVSIATVLELVYSRMREFDVRLDSEQFEYSLVSGKYLFLFDGFDEIPEHLARDAADAVQGFCAKYPDNPCVITSRPIASITPLETFSRLNVLPLTKAQTVMLASKIWDEDEKTWEFCDQLDKSLFEQYRDFAENPLLLTMMFLTFMRSPSITEHLSEFYQRAYEALYRTHDNLNKGSFKREFKCKTLDERQFERLLSSFCFQSYFREEDEFSEARILSYLKKGIERLGLTNVDAADYLLDLQNIVCIIIKNGDSYRFSHPSFQAYFAAYYTCCMADEVQNRWFKSLLGHDILAKIDYCDLLYQLEPNRFAENALEDGLRALQEKVGKTADPNLSFLKEIFDCIRLSQDQSRIYYRSSSGADQVALFDRFIGKKRYWHTEDRVNRNRESYEAIRKILEKNNHDFLSFDDIDSTLGLSDEERGKLYQAIIDYHQIALLRTAVWQWLADQDEKRNKLESSSNLTALLDAL